jgi:sulfatase modifying factor 1
MRPFLTVGALCCALAGGCFHPPTETADGGGSSDAAVDGGVSVDAGLSDAGSPPDAGPCPPEMVEAGGFCVDAYEGYVVELDGGAEVAHSPYLVVDGLLVRAKSAAGVIPQGYISQIQASEACANAGKRLCAAAEFSLACRGPDAGDWYPYGGQTRQPGYCNEGKGSFMPLLFGPDPTTWTYADFNDPRLNQLDGGLASTGSFPRCVSPAGVHDCVGNLHEWGSDPADAQGHGRFRGGFFGDAELNGHGCLYVTSAHDLSYHDYSTGFRCCRDAGP